MQALKIIGLLILAGALSFGAILLFRLAPKISRVTPQAVITNFDECAAAGNPVMESNPEQCRTPDGRVFSRDVLYAAEPMPTDCVIGGCSAQLCGERKDMEGLVSTCEYRAEYACYNRHSACERQSDGQCGWTQTSELKQCLANPPAMDEGMPQVN